MNMKMKQVEELVLQSLEHEMGGVKVYETAVTCAVTSELKEEFQKYLGETRTHVQVLEEICKTLKIDPKQESPGRKVVRTIGQALVEAMKSAKASGDPAAAEIVACESVVIAETKDHLDWELLGKCAENMSGPAADTLKSAYEKIEEQEDEHLYHSKGWCRELWIKSLGLTAVLPPPEERRHVKTAIGAARAEQAAEKER
jgi:ferritin-like metal-binding protein YciE